MRFVPVKTVEQQSRLMVPRARAEFGTVLPQKAEVVRRPAVEHLEDLPGWANIVIGDLLSEVRHLDERIQQYDKHIHAMARECTVAQRLMQLMGVGEATATAIVATVGNAFEFDSGRQFSAWLGLVHPPPGLPRSAGEPASNRPARILISGPSKLQPLIPASSARHPFSSEVHEWRSGLRPYTKKV
jgi:transposase